MNFRRIYERYSFDHIQNKFVWEWTKGFIHHVYQKAMMRNNHSLLWLMKTKKCEKFRKTSRLLKQEEITELFTQMHMLFLKKERKHNSTSWYAGGMSTCEMVPVCGQSQEKHRAGKFNSILQLSPMYIGGVDTESHTVDTSFAVVWVMYHSNWSRRFQTQQICKMKKPCFGGLSFLRNLQTVWTFSC